MNYENLGIKEYFNNLILPRSINLDTDVKDKYIIRMQNMYLDAHGEILKWQKLSTEYKRVIEEQISSFCVLTRLNVEKATFESSERSPMNWSFAAGHSIPYFLLSADTEEKAEFISQAEVFEKVANQVDKFNKSFDRFPKLPSVYLYIMQLYDMIAFENFATYFSCIDLSTEKIGEYVEVEMLSSSKAQIGLGLYSDDSLFKNGKFKAVYLGVSLYKNRECAVFNYICDKSKVKMEDAQINGVREGNSYYSGTLLLDLKTFVPVHGSMIENYIARQKKDNVNVRREIHMHLVEDN
ncbi:hypothetical protein EHE19_014490 [Ruminiclostridium herbifermentans]|uniref:Uncharacterized protein n=1 Tax=Ruminiclostridium herbifermentans TaxID=2488810 RepID=A0A4U7JHK0_9FIRM|nr:hypothetical protein [Ruminiclostridium herbifermentans]QNU66081.1 hypothetical protein EHE19_014490 [Ruminiclostridium herbifermentans]